MTFADAAAALWVQAGGDPAQAATAAAIAAAESSGGAQRYGDDSRFGYTSFGLWQIHTRSQSDNSPVNTLPSGAPYNELLLATNDAYNASAAVAIYNQRNSFSPWSTYTSGKYRAYLGGAIAPKGTPQYAPGNGEAGAPRTDTTTAALAPIAPALGGVLAATSGAIGAAGSFFADPIGYSFAEAKPLLVDLAQRIALALLGLVVVACGVVWMVGLENLKAGAQTALDVAAPEVGAIALHA